MTPRLIGTKKVDEEIPIHFKGNYPIEGLLVRVKGTPMSGKTVTADDIGDFRLDFGGDPNYSVSSAEMKIWTDALTHFQPDVDGGSGDGKFDVGVFIPFRLKNRNNYDLNCVSRAIDIYHSGFNAENIDASKANVVEFSGCFFPGVPMYLPAMKRYKKDLRSDLIDFSIHNTIALLWMQPDTLPTKIIVNRDEQKWTEGDWGALARATDSDYLAESADLGAVIVDMWAGANISVLPSRNFQLDISMPDDEESTLELVVFYAQKLFLNGEEPNTVPFQGVPALSSARVGAIQALRTTPGIGKSRLASGVPVAGD